MITPTAAQPASPQGLRRSVKGPFRPGRRSTVQTKDSCPDYSSYPAVCLNATKKQVDGRSFAKASKRRSYSGFQVASIGWFLNVEGPPNDV